MTAIDTELYLRGTLTRCMRKDVPHSTSLPETAKQGHHPEEEEAKGTPSSKANRRRSSLFSVIGRSSKWEALSQSFKGQQWLGVCYNPRVDFSYG